MASLAGRLDRALKAAGVPIEGVSIGRVGDKGTWTVHPSALQAQAQPIIDAFDPDDPAFAHAEAEAQVDALLASPLATALIETIAEVFDLPSDPSPLIGIDPVSPTILRARPQADVIRARLRRHLRTSFSKE